MPYRFDEMSLCVLCMLHVNSLILYAALFSIQSRRQIKLIQWLRPELSTSTKSKNKKSLKPKLMKKKKITWAFCSKPWCVAWSQKSQQRAQSAWRFNAMSDLESGEDGQMVIVKKRLIWWTPTKTAAFESLHDFQNIEKKRAEASPSLRPRKQK